MAEWLKAVASKATVSQGTAGSNPAPSVKNYFVAREILSFVPAKILKILRINFTHFIKLFHYSMSLPACRLSKLYYSIIHYEKNPTAIR